MARLTRKNIKVFAGSASNNGVFGSLQANNPVQTNDVEQIQSLPAWSEGWDSATETSEDLPPLEDFQGVQYVVTYEQAYLMQEGLPEWASSVTYYKGGLIKEVTSTGFRIYSSLTDNNINNSISDTTNWKKVMDSDDLYAFQSDVTQLQTDVAAISYIGDIKSSVRSSNHGNWFLCNGQAISRTSYATLFGIIGTNFGEGDGTTTFNLPDYRGKFLRGLGGDSAADIYTTQAEGLPNIEGEFSCGGMSIGTQGYTATGAFTHISNPYTGSDGYHLNSTGLGFDASASNAIYGSSEHVTPVNMAINYFIRVK